MSTENLSVNGAGAAGIEAAQTRAAHKITALMTEHVERLPFDVRERLKFAREKAVERTVLATSAARKSPTIATSGLGNGVNVALRLNTGLFGGGFRGGFDGDLWTRLGSLIPLAALVLGLLSIQHFHQRSQISAAAEVDAALLGDDVPFAAYSDPGFVEFLKLDGH